MKKLIVVQVLITVMLLLISCAQNSKDNKENIAQPSEITDVYPAPSCYELSEQASITVNGEQAFIIKNQEQYDYCSFAFSGKATVTIKVNEKIQKCSVSPLAKEYQYKIEDGAVTITMETPEYLIVKINKLREIILCADPIEENAPDPLDDGVFNINATTYGCVPDSQDVVTEKIQNAIDDASKAGGGIVYVPAGVYVTGCLDLHSNVHLYLEPGAVLRLTDNVKELDYTWSKSSINGFTTLPTGGKGPWKGVTMLTCDKDSENIKIYGRGTVDGRGVYMCNNKGTVVKLFYPVGVANLTVEDIILRDSSSWNTVIYACSNVNITGAKVFNEVHTMYEDDGIDICNSQNVTVKHCVIVSEDDPASVKGMKNEPLLPCKDVLWEDIFVWTTTSAFKVGWKGYTAISNVTFRDSYAYSCKNGIGLFHYDGDAPFNAITFENIDVENFLGKYKNGTREPTRAFFFEIKNRGDGASYVNDVTIKNVTFRKAADSSNLLNSMNKRYCFKNIAFIDVYYCGKKYETLADIFKSSEYALNISVQ